MTAYVNIVVAQRRDALLVPNAALRFKPADVAQNGAKRKGKGKDERKKSAVGTVYVLENGKLKPITIGTGITDNKMTEVLSGELKAGDQVVVDEAVSAAPAAGQQQGTVRMRMF
jgi:HlyD family secretion protein